MKKNIVLKRIIFLINIFKYYNKLVNIIKKAHVSREEIGLTGVLIPKNRMLLGIFPRVEIKCLKYGSQVKSLPCALIFF